MTVGQNSTKDSSIEPMQLIKLLVYALLLINFVLYFLEEWEIAQFRLASGSTFLNWAAAYSTTIEEVAWLVLILLFELETYTLEDSALTRRRLMLMHGTRYVCYIILAFTVFSYGNEVIKLRNVETVDNVSSLCQLVPDDTSYTFNRDYSRISTENCTELSSASQFVYLDPPQYLIVTDNSGLVIEWELAVANVVEITTWLLILFCIETSVRLQERAVGIRKADGMMFSLSSTAIEKVVNRAKVVLYGVLWIIIAYWLYRGHYVWSWDEFVWIAGFFLIENNIAAWREETDAADTSSQLTDSED